METDMDELDPVPPRLADDFDFPPDPPPPLRLSDGSGSEPPSDGPDLLERTYQNTETLVSAFTKPKDGAPQPTQVIEALLREILEQQKQILARLNESATSPPPPSSTPEPTPVH